MTAIYEGMVLNMLTIGEDCTGQDIGEILTEKEQQGFTPTKYFGIDYICCMATLLGGVKGNGYLIASASSIDKITDLINKYFFSTTFYLKQKYDNEYLVFNKNGLVKDFIVVKKGSRYRFEYTK